MATVTVQLVGLEQVQAEFRGIRDDQLPFATALSLTRTAQDAQRVIQTEVLPGRFVLRSPQWMKAGIRIVPAKKTELAAAVGDIHRFMPLQETGGTKIPYGNAIAVPLSGVRAWGSRKLITPDLMPAAIMQNGGFIRNHIMYRVAFKAGRRGRLARGVAGISRAANWSRQIIPMYALVSHATIRPRYGFAESVAATVADKFTGNFAQAFKQAVRTAR